MHCGECSVIKCCFDVILLAPEHISTEYLDSLNDKQHLVHSRNVVNTHTLKSQTTYIQNFNFTDNLIIGVKCINSKKIIATATLILDHKKGLVNIGILIFRGFSGRGYGHIIFGIISDFCFEIFPGFPQEIGTSFENHAMQKIALKVGFEFSSKTNNSKFFHYRRTFELHKNLKFLKHSPSLVVANDAGASAHLAAMLHAFKISPPSRLSGPAIQIFDRYGAKSSEPFKSVQKDSLDYVLLGSSLFGGPESQALLDPALFKFRKVALLDNWVNYQERFHPSGQILPDALLLTNHFAFLKAKDLFPNSEILEIPDFQLAHLKLEFMKKHRDAQSAVIILEPESNTAFGGRFPQKSLDLLLKDVHRIATERNVQRIVLRPHPSHNFTYIGDLAERFGHMEFVTISRNADVIDDLINANFVVGFHSYALYLSAELGIKTFGYFTDEADHWTHNFPKIQPVNTNI